MTRDELKQTKEWQALNTIWKTMTPQQRGAMTEEFKCLTHFIDAHARPPVNYDAIDAAYQDALSPRAAAFAREREGQDHQNLYAELMKLIAGSTFEGPEKVFFFYKLKYGKSCPWVQDSPDEVMEIVNLAWNRQVERGFVPGEGFPDRRNGSRAAL